MTETKINSRENWFAFSNNFGGLPAELSGKSESNVVVLPAPYEATTTYGSGCRNGPSAIISASTNMELYDEEIKEEICKVGIYTSPPLETPDSAEEMLERIDAVVTEYLERGKLVTLLGGEHTVTLGMVYALNRAYSDLSVLFLDAHADFRQSYRGNKYSHACVARRTSELCRIAQVGIRSLSSEEAAALKKENVPILWGSELRSSTDTGHKRELINHLIENLAANVHISVDADVFDPSIMPAVGTPEPGGLGWTDVLDVLRAVAKMRKVVGLDFVELAPVAGFIHSEFAAARLLYKAWAYILKDRLV